MISRLLSIAGSDSGGGAGIQADIKTASAFGVYAATAVTAVTAQNTRGVEAVHVIPANIVESQISCVLDDIGADAVKVGMLATAEICGTVAQALSALTCPIIVDPVMISTSGSRLLDEQAIGILFNQLLPMASLVTPNIPEFDALFSLNQPTAMQRTKVAKAFCERFGTSVLIKGGHDIEHTVTDTLVTANTVHTFQAPRLYTANTHGTGCTLSAAIASLVARGMNLVDAVSAAHDFVQLAIKTAPGLGQGHGPLNFLQPKK